MDETTMVPVFTPEQIIRDARFLKRADALRVVLTEEAYTLEEAQAVLDAFLKREVE